eukprot:scaffold186721_cov35-Tisochrysis_lutea.AAC.1
MTVEVSRTAQTKNCQGQQRKASSPRWVRLWPRCTACGKTRDRFARSSRCPCTFSPEDALPKALLDSGS